MRWVLVGLSVLWMPLVWAAPDLTMTVAPTASSGATITASDENTRNNAVANAYNSHTHTDITQTGTALNVGASSGRSSISDTSVVLEGATNNDFEATLSVTDPTVDSTLAINANNLTATRTVTIPDANSVTLPSGAVYYMITGSCPAGTTDVTATYDDRFLRVDATQGTTGGATTVTLTTTELPAHTHTGPSHTHTATATATGAGGNGGVTGGTADTSDDGSITSGAGGTGATGSAGSGTAFSILPQFVTAKLCQVD